MYLKLFIQKDSICQSVYSSHVNGQNLHNNPAKKKKKIWDLLQIMVSTGCIESVLPPRRAACLEIMLLEGFMAIWCPLKLKIGTLGLAFGVSVHQIVQCSPKPGKRIGPEKCFA